jgi:hypothetical protein
MKQRKGNMELLLQRKKGNKEELNIGMGLRPVRVGRVVTTDSEPTASFTQT